MTAPPTPPPHPSSATIAADYYGIMADGDCQTQVTVTVRDQFDHPFPNADVTFQLANGPAGMHPASTAYQVTNAYGQASIMVGSPNLGASDISAVASQYVGAAYYQVSTPVPAHVSFVSGSPVMWSHNDPSYGGAEYHNFDGGGFGNLQIWCTEFQHGGSFAIHADAHSSPLGPISGSFNTAGNSQIFAIMRRTEWAYDPSSPNVPPAGWLFTEGFVGKASANVWLSGIGHATASVDINSTLPLDTGYSVYPNAYVNVYQGSDADPEELIGFKSQTQAVSLGDSDVIGYYIVISGNADVSFLAKPEAEAASGTANGYGYYTLSDPAAWHEHVHPYT